MSSPPTTWDSYFRVPLVRVNGVDLPRRTIFNFITDLNPDSPTVEDDEVNEQLDIPLTGFIGTVPGGAVGQLQFHGLDGSDPIFKGTSKLTADATSGELTHSGVPTHKETGAQFKDGSANSYAQPLWKVATTSNATATILAAIALPSGLGDGIVTVHAEYTYYYASSGAQGGNLSSKSVFKRSSGTLSRVAWADLSNPSLVTGTAVGGHDVVADGNTQIDVKGTGIASTDIVWIVSLHIQVAVP